MRPNAAATDGRGLPRRGDLCSRRSWQNRAAALGHSDLRSSYANLAGANLAGTDLSGLDLHASDLARSLLANADLSGVSFRRCILRGADLRGAVVRGADLRAANLRETDLRGADLDGARIARASVRSARADPLTRWPAGFAPAVRGVVIEGALPRGPGAVGPKSSACNGSEPPAAIGGLTRGRPSVDTRQQYCRPQLESDRLGGVSQVPIEALSRIAEIAIGLAGFAGVAVMLGQGPGRWGAGDALRIRLLLGAAFAALFASLIATGSFWAGASDRASVRLGAAVLLVGQVYWGAVVARQIPRLEAPDRAVFDPRVALLMRLIMFSSWAAQLVVLSGVLPAAASWLFLYGLLVCLAYAALAFVRLLYIRPASE